MSRWFRGRIEKSPANPAGWSLRTGEGKVFDLMFPAGKGGPPAVGGQVKVRGRVRRDVMGIGMGPVLEVEGIEPV